MPLRDRGGVGEAYPIAPPPPRRRQLNSQNRNRRRSAPPRARETAKRALTRQPLSVRARARSRRLLLSFSESAAREFRAINKSTVFATGTCRFESSKKRSLLEGRSSPTTASMPNKFDKISTVGNEARKPISSSSFVALGRRAENLIRRSHLSLPNQKAAETLARFRQINMEQAASKAGRDRALAYRRNDRVG